MLVKKDNNGLRYQESKWGPGYALSIPIPTNPPMTEEELLDHKTPFDALILWSGGNGPHKYQVTKVSKEIFSFLGYKMDGGIDLETCSLSLSDQTKPRKQLNHAYVGKESYSTKVWALEKIRSVVPNKEDK